MAQQTPRCRSAKPLPQRSRVPRRHLRFSGGVAASRQDSVTAFGPRPAGLGPHSRRAECSHQNPASGGRRPPDSSPCRRPILNQGADAPARRKSSPIRQDTRREVARDPRDSHFRASHTLEDGPRGTAARAQGGAGHLPPVLHARCAPCTPAAPRTGPLGRIRYTWTTGRATLAVAEPVRELDGADAGSDSCPPELAGAGVVASARRDRSGPAGSLARAGLALDPRRIDVYQLGALLCQLLRVRPSRPTCAAENQVPGSDAAAAADHGRSAITRPNASPTATPTPSRWRRSSGPSPRRRPKRLPDGGGSASPRTPRLGGPDRPPAPPLLPRPSFRSPGGALPHRRADRPRRHGRRHLGFEESLQRRVAIKRLSAELAHEEFVRRFRAEATAVASLTHPNVVPIYFIGQEAGHHFFAMQYVKGESLDRLLARRKLLPG